MKNLKMKIAIAFLCILGVAINVNAHYEKNNEPTSDYKNGVEIAMMPEILSAEDVGFLVDKATGTITGVSDKGISGTILIPYSIDDTVITAIGAHAFSGCQLTGVVFAENSAITKIGRNAFQNNPSIKNIIIPEGVTIIDDSAFDKCTYLETIELPSTLEKIGNHTFSECKSLSHIDIPSGVKEIGIYAFSKNAALETVVLPETLEKLGYSAFANCASLKEITIPAKLKQLESRAFEYCTSLKKVTLNEGVESIGNSVFLGCDALDTLITPGVINNSVPSTLKKIDTRAFYRCQSLEILDFNQVELINQEAFYAAGLTKVVIPDTVTTIGVNAFTYLPNLESVTLSNQPITIGQRAFASNGKMEHLEFGLGDHIFGTEVFRGSGLKEVEIPDTITGNLSTGMFSYSRQLAKVTIGSGIKVINNYAFRDTILEEIIIGDNVTSLGLGVFYNCEKLTRVDIPSEVTSIGGSVFYKCDSLLEVHIPHKYTNEIEGAPWGLDAPEKAIIYWKGVVKAGDEGDEWLLDTTLQSTIRYLGNKSEVKVPNSVLYEGEEVSIHTVGEHSCYGTYGETIEQITIPEGIETIESNAFARNKKITSIDFPQSLKTIEDGAFEYINSLTSVTFADQLEYIGNSAFYSCKIQSIEFPSTINYIGSSAFAYNALTSIKFKPKESTETVSADSVNITTGVVIGGHAFSKNSNLESVDLGNNIETIDSYVFNECSKIEQLTIPESVQNIHAYTFAKMNGLSKIYIPSKVYDTIPGQPWNAPKAIVYWKGMADINDWVINFEDPSDAVAVKYVGTDTEIVVPVAGAFIGENKKEIDITVKSLGDKALENNRLVTQVRIPEGIEMIGENTFSGCTKLQDVMLPDSLKTIKKSAFKNCDSIVEMIVPKSVELIEEEAFSNCDKMQRIEIKSSLTTIPTSMCYLNRELHEVVLPDTVTTIGRSAFQANNKLINVVWPENLETIEDSAFNSTGIETLKLNDTVTSIGVSSFSSCVNLKKVELSNEMTEIPNYAFSQCTSLEDVTIGEKVETISGAAFYGCESLEKIVLPVNVKTFTSVKAGLFSYLQAFSKCDNLKEIYARYKDQDEIPNAAWGVSNYEAVVYWRGVYNYDGWIVNTQTQTVLKYIGDEVDLEIPTSVIIPENEENAGQEVYITRIENNAFKDRTMIESFVIPEGITYIGENAFKGTKIKEIVIPGSVETIGLYAFYKCSELSQVTLNYGLKVIGTLAFSEAPITSIDIPGSVESIGYNSFYDCKELKNLKIENGVQQIYSSAFENCEKLENFTLPNSITKIDGAFRNCDSLTSIIIPDSVESCNDAFTGSDNLETVIVGAGIDRVKKTFSKLPSLKRIEFRSSNIILESDAFIECPKLEIVRIGRVRATAPTSMTSLQPWSGPASLRAYYLGEYVLFDHEIQVSEDPTKRDIHLFASIDGAVILQIKYPDGRVENVSSDQKEFIYTVSENASYTFIGEDTAGVETIYTVVVDDIGVPIISCEDAIAALSDVKTFTKEDVLTLINAKANTEGGEALDIKLSDADLSRVKGLSNPGEKVRVTISTSSKEGVTRTAQATITAQSVFGYYKVYHYIENTNRDGYTQDYVYEFSAEKGEVVTAEPVEMKGLYFDDSVEGTITSGTVTTSGTELLLHLYYTRERHTIKFQYEDAREASPDQILKYGATLIAPTSDDLEIRDGYCFEGWSPNIVETIENDATYTTIYGENTTYTVEHYTEDLDGSTYTLMEDDSEIISAPAGLEVTAASKKYEGFTFDLENELTQNVGEVQADGSLVLKMYYSRNSYTVKFVFDDNNLEDEDSTNDEKTNVIEPQILKYGAPILQPTSEDILSKQEESHKDASYFDKHVFAHWDSEVLETMGHHDITYTAIYIHKDIHYGTYYVEYYQENFDGTFTIVETKIGEGVRDSEVITAEIYDIEGFTHDPTVEGTLLSGKIPAYSDHDHDHHSATYESHVEEDDGCENDLRLAVYYKRNIYEINFIYEDGSQIIPTQTLKYEMDIVKPDEVTLKEIPYYSFNHWTPVVPEIATKSETYIAIYTQNKPYTIIYYQQDAISEQYRVLERITHHGKIGETVTAEILDFDHSNFNAKKSTVSGVIPHEDQLALALYYDLNTYTIEFVYEDGTPVVDEQILRYGATITEPKEEQMTIPEDYEFTGWTPTLPEKVTTDAKFVAQFTKMKGIPVISCEDAVVPLSDVQSYTCEDVLTIINAQATSEEGEALDIHLSDEDLAFVQGMRVHGEQVVVTISTTSKEGITKTAQATITAKTVFGNYKVYHYVENIDGSGYTQEQMNEYTAEKGSIITVEPIEIMGCHFDENSDKNVLTGTVTSGETELSLHVYYDRNLHTVKFQYEDAREAFADQLVKYGATLTVPTSDSLEVRNGYTFEGWTPEIVETVLKDATYTTVYGENTTYTVEHYTENLDDSGYTLMNEDTEVISAPIGLAVKATSKSYTGFTFDQENPSTVDTGIVEAGGTLILKMYYSRNTHTVRFVFDDSDSNDTKTNIIDPQVLKYGASITQPTLDEVIAKQAVSNKGEAYFEEHIFAHWDVAVAETIGDHDITYTAIYINKDVKYGTYYVEHYKENLDGTYSIVDIETGEGQREEETITATIKGYEGFTHDPNVEGTLLSGTIPAYDNHDHELQFYEAVLNEDGGCEHDLRLAVYYKRNTFEINFVYEDGTQVLPTQTLKYEMDIEKPSNDMLKDIPYYSFRNWSPEVPSTALQNGTYTAIYEADKLYTITYYQQNAFDDDYSVIKRETHHGKIGDIITADILTFDHLNFNEAKSTISGEIIDGSDLALALYYDLNTYTIEFVYEDDTPVVEAQVLRHGQMIKEPTSEQITVEDGYEFVGWLPEVPTVASEDGKFVAHFENKLTPTPTPTPTPGTTNPTPTPEITNPTPAPGISTPEPTISPAVTEAPTPGNKVPNTGDTSNLGWFIGMLVVSTLGVFKLSRSK